MKKNKKQQDIPAEEKIDAADWQVIDEEKEEKKEEGAETSAEQAQESAPDPVEELQKQLAEAKNDLLYLQAEYQNFRRRSLKDISDARSYAVSDTLVPFLTVFDYLSMAEVAANKSDNIEAIRQGLQMIISQFFKAFDELGVQKFESVGKEFDPKLHDAVSNEPSAEIAEGKIIREWSCGFKIGDKLLRPARVVVSSGEAKPGPEAESSEEKTNDGEK